MLSNGPRLDVRPGDRVVYYSGLGDSGLAFMGGARSDGTSADGPGVTFTTEADTDTGAWVETPARVVSTQLGTSAVLRIKTGADIGSMVLWVGLFRYSPTASQEAENQVVAARYATDVDGTAFWRFVTCDGTTLNEQVTTVAVATSTLYQVRIDVAAATTTLWVNGTYAAVATTQLPTSTDRLYLGAYLRTLNSTAKSFTLLSARCGSTHQLLDAHEHHDTEDTDPVKGMLIVGKGASGQGAWSTLGVGTDTHLLVADSAQTLGVKWASPAAIGATIVVQSKDSTVSNATTIDFRQGFQVSESPGGEANVALLLTETGRADAGAIYGTQLQDSNANEVIKLGETVAAVNEITVTNAATGGTPTIAATGDDANVPLAINTKGSVGLSLGASSFSLMTLAGKKGLVVTPDASAVNYLTISSAATGNDTVISASGTDTNVGLNITTQNAGTVKINSAAVYYAGGTDVAIADGGTGASSASVAFDNLAPTTTRGDLIVRDAGGNARVAIGTAGKVLKSDGTDAAWGYGTGHLVLAPQVLTVGSGTHTTSANTTRIFVELVGGGAGGGGCSSSASSGAAGGGGGAGGYCGAWFTVTASTGYSYTVGAKGTGGANTGGTGSAGADSTFDVGGTVATAKGGSGGVGQTAGTAAAFAAGGAGGTVSTSGTINGAGAPGTMALRITGTLASSGAGGSTQWGGGGVGRTANGAGNAATGYGAGGGGGLVQNNSGAVTGGNGGDGLIVVWEYSS